MEEAALPKVKRGRTLPGVGQYPVSPGCDSGCPRRLILTVAIVKSIVASFSFLLLPSWVRSHNRTK